jgi:hypothetical protein
MKEMPGIRSIQGLFPTGQEQIARIVQKYGKIISDVDAAAATVQPARPAATTQPGAPSVAGSPLPGPMPL